MSRKFPANLFIDSVVKNAIYVFQLAIPTFKAFLVGLISGPLRTWLSENQVQIGQSFEALGASIELESAVIVGGLDMVLRKFPPLLDVAIGQR